MTDGNDKTEPLTTARRCATVSVHRAEDWREPARVWWQAGEDPDDLVAFAADGGAPRFTETLIRLRNIYGR